MSVNFGLEAGNYRSTERDAGFCRLLIVEDNPADVFLIEMALDSQGLQRQLFVAVDGDEAFQLLDRIDREVLPCPDLVVLDLNLPRRNGFEVLQRVRKSSRCGQKPIVMLSSADSPSERARASGLGLTMYLRKPFALPDVAELGRRLRDLIPSGFE